jgi:hypothetical protein
LGGAIHLERSSSPPAPDRQLLLCTVAIQLCGGFNQQSQQHGAIIVGQLDQSGLGDEP